MGGGPDRGQPHLVQQALPEPPGADHNQAVHCGVQRLCANHFQPGLGPGSVHSEGQVGPHAYRLQGHAQAKMAQSVTVPSAPLGYLLRAAGVKYIDLLSLDVEGSEKVVLDTMVQ